jgi:hypothetical protein
MKPKYLSNVRIINIIMNNIKDLFVNRRQEFFLVLIQIANNFLLLLVAFSVGILYERNRFEQWYQVQIQENPEKQIAWQEFRAEGIVKKQFVASKNGTKVYPVDCSSAKRIKEENRIYFQNIKQAHELGYETSKQCETN